MDKLRLNRFWYSGSCLALAMLSLFEGGCLLVAAGAAGGAAAGYAYYKGKICQPYCANFEDTWAAVHTALSELGMPILHEERHDAGGLIKTQTADGDRIRIKLELVPSKIPAEGPLTEVSVRVGAFGDHPVSERVLCQIGAHLVPGPVLNPQPATSVTPIPPALSTAPPTTEPTLPSSPGTAALPKAGTAPLLPLEPLPTTGK